MHKDPVTPAVHAAVQARDWVAMVTAMATWWETPQEGMESAFRALKNHPACVAPVVDPIEWGNCWGRSTLDHIKDQPRMGKRAQSDSDHLVSLCQGHTEDGRKAGYQWNTAHRYDLRDYLRRRGAGGS
jgi:hypothetical protein